MFGIGKVKILIGLALVVAAIIAITTAATMLFNAGYRAGEDAAFDSVEKANQEGIENGERLVQERRACRARGGSWSVVSGVCS